MSKQRPDTDKLANDLSGASAFFRSPKPTPDQQPGPEIELTSPGSPFPVPGLPKLDSDAPSSPDVMTSQRHSVMTSPEIPPSPPKEFDINRPTASRDSLRLSVDETKALDTLRAALKWDYDLTVSKNDICRAALHWLLEDFQTKGDKSAAVSRLKRKNQGR